MGGCKLVLPGAGLELTNQGKMNEASSGWLRVDVTKGGGNKTNQVQMKMSASGEISRLQREISGPNQGGYEAVKQ